MRIVLVHKEFNVYFLLYYIYKNYLRNNYLNIYKLKWRKKIL